MDEIGVSKLHNKVVLQKNTRHPRMESLFQVTVWYPAKQQPSFDKYDIMQCNRRKVNADFLPFDTGYAIILPYIS